jgi:tryptophanyl-tRNA synthetase
MSKSAKTPAGLIEILDDEKTLTKKIKSAVTDTGTEVTYDPETKPGVSNLLTIHSALSGRSVEELVSEFEGRMYGHLKVAVAEVVVETLRPLRTRTLELLDDPAELSRVLDAGADAASAIAQRTIEQVFDRVGFLHR